MNSTQTKALAAANFQDLNGIWIKDQKGTRYMAEDNGTCWAMKIDRRGTAKPGTEREIDFGEMLILANV